MFEYEKISFVGIQEEKTKNNQRTNHFRCHSQSSDLIIYIFQD